MYDVIVVGGGFAGVTAARECAKAGRRVLLLEARNRLGGRTATDRWDGLDIELGGAQVHWHQPHVWSEITRAGLAVEVSSRTDSASWYFDTQRQSGPLSERDAIAERGWDRFVDGAVDALPNPYAPLDRIDRLVRLDSLSIAERLAELDLDPDERDVLTAELEALAHGFLEEAGAASVLRWHALSGYSFALTQHVGGHVRLGEGTAALLTAIAGQAEFDTVLATPAAAIVQSGGAVEVHARTGDTFQARAAIIAVPLNTLAAVEFMPPLSERKEAAVALGQASRGIKIFLRVRGEPLRVNAVKPGHPLGYLHTEVVHGDGTQTLVAFGRDSRALGRLDERGLQEALDEVLPGYRVLASRTHDWVEDEFSRGTWAIHRPGWYSTYHGEMQRPEGRVVLSGSDIANGWSGFIDGAIESGIRAAARVSTLLA